MFNLQIECYIIYYLLLNYNMKWFLTSFNFQITKNVFVKQITKKAIIYINIRFIIFTHVYTFISYWQVYF